MNGKVQVENAVITYGKFDPKKLVAVWHSDNWHRALHITLDAL
jgi:hypothetical protein